MGANGYRHGMRATCGVLLLAGSLASAQDAPAPGDGVLQEVVVTARGRVEELQTVPLAITSISGKDLEYQGVENIREIAYLSPSVTIRSSGAENAVRAIIRGQADLNGGVGDPGAAIFLDGIYLSNPSAVSLGVVNLERVEVVKGPVSALYGRNAANGAINYISRFPGEKLDYSLSARVGGDGLAGGRLFVGGPVAGDWLKASLAWQYETYDGGYEDRTSRAAAGDYTKNDGQLALELTPFDALRIRGTWYHGDDQFGYAAATYWNNNCGVAVPAGLSAAERAMLPEAGAFCGEFDTDKSPYSSPPLPDVIYGNGREVDFYSARVDYDFGPVSVMLLAGWNDATSLRRGNLQAGKVITVPLREPGAPANCVFLVNPLCDQTVNVTGTYFGGNIVTSDDSLELRLSSAADQRIRWQLGAFKYDEDNFSYNAQGTRADLSAACLAAAGTATGCQVGAVAPNATLTDLLVNQTALALVPTATGTVGLVSNDGALLLQNGTLRTASQESWFVGLDGDLTDRWVLSAEYRKVDDERTLATKSPTSGAIIGAVRSSDFSYDNWRATLKWAISDSVMSYASAGTGTRAGGFNGATTYVPEQTFEPEENTTYELGLKSTWLDGRLQFNASVFQIDADNMQITVATEKPDFVIGVDPFLVVKNVGIVKTQGIEFEAQWTPVASTRFNLGLGWSDPKIGRVFKTSAARSPASPATSPANADPITNCLAIASCAGRVDTVDIDPTAGTTLRYRASLKGLTPPAVSKLTATAGVDFAAAAFGDWRWRAHADYRYESKQYVDEYNLAWWGPRNLVNGRLGLEKKGLRVELFVDNAFDDQTPELVSYGFENRTGGLTLAAGSLPNARVYGLQLTYAP